MTLTTSSLPQLPIEVWAHIISFAENWNDGRIMICNFFSVNKYFDRIACFHYYELLTYFHDEAGDELLMIRVNERIKDRLLDEKWFVCKDCKYLYMRKRGESGCGRCGGDLTNDEEEEEATLMVRELNKRQCGCFFICRECESLGWLSDEPAVLCYNRNGNRATFCRDCTLSCHYCSSLDDEDGGRYCAEWTDGHDDCEWQYRCY